MVPPILSNFRTRWKIQQLKVFAECCRICYHKCSKLCQNYNFICCCLWPWTHTLPWSSWFLIWAHNEVSWKLSCLLLQSNSVLKQKSLDSYTVLQHDAGSWECMSLKKRWAKKQWQTSILESISSQKILVQSRI